MFIEAESLKAEMRAQTLDDLSRGELCDRVEAIGRVKAALASFEARLCRAIDQLDDAGVDGAGVLRSVGLASSRAAGAVSRVAVGLAALPIATAALEEGRFTFEHAAILVRAATKVSSGRVDAELVERARQCPADIFAKEVRSWIADNTKPDVGEDELAGQRRLRRASFWTDDDGLLCLLTRFEPIVGKQIKARVLQRYEELWQDDGGRDGSPHEVRSHEQRMADAVADVLLRSSDGASPARPHPRTQLIITADLGRLSLDDPAGAAELIGHGAIPQGVLERLACNSELAGVLFNGIGRPIWVGRDQRSASVAQWKALIARDRGCIGCDADPSRCEAHHIIAWNDLGPTDITNLVLVCSRCHHDIHDRGAQLRQAGDGRFHIDYRAGPLTLAA